MSDARLLAEWFPEFAEHLDKMDETYKEKRTIDEKLAFMKEAVPLMTEISGNDPRKMMAEIIPFCMDMDKMPAMMKGMI